jgi:hypothetical protein
MIGIFNSRSLAGMTYNNGMKTKYSATAINLEPYAPRILAMCLLAVILLLASTGCKNETRATTAINPAGGYTLVSVDGKNVPSNLIHEGVAMIVKSGSLIINTDGTCISHSVFAVPPHQDINREVKATYTQQGAELTMRWQGAGMTKGQINGNTFTMNNEGMIFSYRK